MESGEEEKTSLQYEFPHPWKAIRNSRDNIDLSNFKQHFASFKKQNSNDIKSLEKKLKKLKKNNDDGENETKIEKIKNEINARKKLTEYDEKDNLKPFDNSYFTSKKLKELSKSVQLDLTYREKLDFFFQKEVKKETKSNIKQSKELLSKLENNRNVDAKLKDAQDFKDALDFKNALEPLSKKKKDIKNMKGSIYEQLQEFKDKDLGLQLLNTLHLQQRYKIAEWSERQKLKEDFDQCMKNGKLLPGASITDSKLTIINNCKKINEKQLCEHSHGKISNQLINSLKEKAREIPNQGLKEQKDTLKSIRASAKLITLADKATTYTEKMSLLYRAHTHEATMEDKDKAILEYAKRYPKYKPLIDYHKKSFEELYKPDDEKTKNSKGRKKLIELNKELEAKLMEEKYLNTKKSITVEGATTETNLTKHRSKLKNSQDPKILVR